MRDATISRHRAMAILQALVLAGLFLVAALSAGEQAHHPDGTPLVQAKVADGVLPKG